MGKSLKKQPSAIDALDPIDDVLEMFLGIPKKRKPREEILSGDFLINLD